MRPLVLKPTRTTRSMTVSVQKFVLQDINDANEGNDKTKEQQRAREMKELKEAGRVGQVGKAKIFGRFVAEVDTQRLIMESEGG